jgi:CheY-specific phosphatase CheX
MIQILLQYSWKNLTPPVIFSGWKRTIKNRESEILSVPTVEDISYLIRACSLIQEQADLL